MQHLELTPPHRLVMGRHGTFLVNLNDIYIGRSIALYGEHGEIEHAFVRQFINPARDIAEVGANMGAHSVALARIAAQQGRRLLAVEPQPVQFQNLCANLALNSLFNVRAENCACAAEAGTLSFVLPDYLAEGNFGGVRMEAARAGQQAVRSLPLDELLDASWDLGFLKIDVEGFEQSVLAGASRSVARCRPVIYLENDQPDRSRALIEALWAMDYQCWYHLPPLFNPDNFAGQAQNVYDDLVSFNMLCLPCEAPHTINGPPISDAGFHPLAPAAT